ncbi:zinc-binding alcohol dehydrogenase family protein [Aspergillus thermomutatus]|uniref:Enoyl reductase (ER) domain-containing protein n=1 Tax=Aspergillus thermomutatus TaxID=41047 RepID=A0A397H3H8_ASPTH|nr:uncharacterized protein CDV56_105065 [Aspergillus thermomutatus]RHZ57675.1 hypothetical protein CDV56_105065 [Aspergillus thermomutatus]
MQNQACWQNAACEPVELGPAGLYEPGPGQILVKNKCIAFSPIDFKDQRFQVHPKRYPAILGTSFAGDVLAVGPDVIEFQPGDRVAVNRADRTLSDPAHGVYQRYALASVETTTRIPERTSLESAAAIMINLTTMVAALSHHMGLARPPTDGDGIAPRNGLRILIYGGSSSCGGLGTRYASDAGYSVVTTSSPQNRAFVETLGATHIIDHSQPEGDIVAEFKGHGPYHAVIDCVSLPPSFKILCRLLGETGGVLYGLHPTKGPRFQFEFPPQVEYRYFPMAWALEEEANRDLREWYYQRYLPWGLSSGRIVPTRHRVVEGGLENVQKTLDILATGGVNGHKLVMHP